jgi:hypothetical protein
MANRLFEDVAEIKCDMKWVKSTMKIHMGQHFRVRLMMAGAVIAAIASVIVGVVM